MTSTCLALPSSICRTKLLYGICRPFVRVSKNDYKQLRVISDIPTGDRDHPQLVTEVMR